MCTITFKTAGTPMVGRLLLEKIVAKMMKQNQDGSGYGIRRPNGTLIFKKGFYVPLLLVENLINDLVETKDELVIHSRMATHGTTSARNCHPIALNAEKVTPTGTTLTGKVNENYDGFLLFHNGIFERAFTDPQGVYSDTYLFAKNFVQRFKCLESKEGMSLLSHYMHARTNGKLAILAKTGFQTFGNFKKDMITEFYSSNNGGIISTTKTISTPPTSKLLLA
jgi:predicted glutamine amidotransferase